MNSDITELKNLWAQLRDLPLIEQNWPSESKQTYLDYLAHRDATEAQKLREEFEFVSEFSILPIVAVAGLINSGKSSLVCAFLSSKSRKRVLRGVASQNGTQRFTLWVPAMWRKNPAFFARLEHQLARVFRHAPELLAENSEEAHVQQRNRKLIHVPLLGLDQALDPHGIALLDCPDIQRKGANEAADSNTRLEVLMAAGEICAGVILVAGRKEIEVSTLEVIAAALPSATRIYAINLLRLESVEEVLDEVRAKFRLSHELCFVAYDHLVNQNRTFAPAIDPNFADSADPDHEGRVPFFFEAVGENEQNAPDAIATERSVLHLGKRLGSEALRQKRQRELISELADGTDSALKLLPHAIANRGRILDAAVSDMFEQCHQLLHDGEDQRIKFSPDMALSLMESARRTAPRDIRAILWISRGLFKVMESIAHTAGKVLLRPINDLLKEHAPKTTAFIGAVVDRLLSKIGAKENAFIKPEDVQERLALWSSALGIVKDGDFWRLDAIHILDRFREEERTNMLPDQWDSLTGQAWKTAPKIRARFLAVIPFMAALICLALLHFEPTGALSHAILGVTMQGLLTGAALGGVGFSAIFGVVGAEHLLVGIQKMIGPLQISNFFGIACDQIGLPREIPENRKAEYLMPHIAEQRKNDAFGIKECGWIRARINQENLEKLRALITRI